MVTMTTRYAPIRRSNRALCPADASVLRKLHLLIFFIPILLFAMSNSSEAQEKGIIGKYTEDGSPVILKFVNEFPTEDVRNVYRWLTVISWEYDGGQNNGMPPKDTNLSMISLEDALDVSLEKEGHCKHAYSRTGNNLKEFVYYTENQEIFLAAFNNALVSHPLYPIEITFYEDQSWEDFQRILGKFRNIQ
jgi:hypothetical protein